ncbi:MAG: hypothetical protein L3J84_07040 [Gammaproteobacteria bacterium]|nr:hypothetical protein [Gammaproteobacteria bacterium]
MNPPDPPPQHAYLSALGACTPLGDSISSAAAFRADINRLETLEGVGVDDDDIEEAPRYSGYTCQSFTGKLEGLARYIRMGSAAINELKAQAPSADWQTSGNTAYICTLANFLEEPIDELGLDQTMEEEINNEIRSEENHYIKRLFNGIGAECGLTIPEAQQFYLFRGSIGFFKGINKAIELLNNQQCQYVVVGAIDSLVDPARLEMLEGEGRLKDTNNPTGIIPGEAACFLLLTLNGPASNPKVQINPAHFSQEPQHYFSGEPATGEGLKALLAPAMADPAENSPLAQASLYHDLNGEPYRAYEWGITEVMLKQGMPVESWPRHLPAESFGDTGVAYGALATLLACRAIIRGYNWGQPLILCSDNLGERALLAPQPVN